MSTSSVNIFITTDYKRDYFRSLTKHALYVAGFDVIMVEKPMLERYLECERLATSPFYILCDDDVVPATDDTLYKLIKIMYQHPEYSQLGLSWQRNMSLEENNGWIREKTVDAEGTRIWEMDHVGGCVAIRKGTIKNTGGKAEYGDDRIFGESARNLGYKVGIVPDLYFHHLGAK